MRRLLAVVVSVMLGCAAANDGLLLALPAAGTPPPPQYIALPAAAAEEEPPVLYTALPAEEAPKEETATAEDYANDYAALPAADKLTPSYKGVPAVGEATTLLECRGTEKRLLVDFEASLKGSPLESGQRPDKLPGNIRVRGRRQNNRSQFFNEAMILDTKNNPAAAADAGWDDDEEHVLIISKNDDPLNPVPDDVGGKVVFRFKQPILHLRGIKFLNVTEPNGRIIARTMDGGKLRVPIPVGDVNYVEPENWRGIQKLRINLVGSGAIAALDVTYCDDETDVPDDPVDEDDEEEDDSDNACPQGQVVSPDTAACMLPGNWEKTAQLPGSSMKEIIGQATKLSGDGQTIVAGYGDVVRVFRRDATVDEWNQIGHDIPEAGTVVDISYDGNVIAANGAPVGCDTISAYKYDASKNDWFLINEGGRAIFAQDVDMSGDGSIVVAGSIDFGLVGVFTLKDDSWSMVGQGYLEEFDSSFGDFGGYQTCSADGSTFAVGYPGYALQDETEDEEETADVGCVTVYRVSDDKTNFEQLGPIIVGLDEGERTGSNMALSRDGSTIAIASGIPFDREPKPGPGAVTVYRYNEDTNEWQQVGQKLLGQSTDEMGARLSLSDDGSTLAVGSPGFNKETGRVQIYKWTENVWTEYGPSVVGDKEYERFGSISMSGDATIVAIGSPTKGDQRNSAPGTIDIVELSHDEKR